MTPAAAPPRRPRLTWVFAALAIANVVLAAIIVIVISRRPPATTVTVQPAGGGALDAETKQLLRRLEQEQRELERKLAEVQQLRSAVEQLAERVRQCEHPDRPTPPKPTREVPAPIDLGSCDEVACVLSNYEGACCAKYRRGAAPAPSKPTSALALPDGIDRSIITAGIATVRARVLACGQRATANGMVKVKVRVSPAGLVERVLVERSLDPDVDACVASAIMKATFEPTHHGGSFSYPFVFGASP